MLILAINNLIVISRKGEKVKVMIEKEIRLLFNSGQLKDESIVPALMTEGWSLKFNRVRGQSSAMDVQRISPRVFKIIDSAFKVAIGFRFCESRIIL